LSFYFKKEPIVVDEFNRDGSMVDYAVVASVWIFEESPPSSSTFYVFREVVCGSSGDPDTVVVVTELYDERSHSVRCFKGSEDRYSCLMLCPSGGTPYDLYEVT
jgi:hypothetical protein